MTTESSYGVLISGVVDDLNRAADRFEEQPVDLNQWTETPSSPYPVRETTLARSATVRGPGTFFGKATRTLVLEPFEDEGWWFSRSDRTEDLPTQVSVRNVWTTGQTISNIVLRSGDPHNYVRMVEHIVALRLGLGLDRLMIRTDSGDPPLFNRGSLDLVEAIDQAGIVETAHPARWVTVKEPVCAVTPGGAFLVFKPCPVSHPRLRMDVGIDFPTVIGRQRIRFDLHPDVFRAGAVARTNSSAGKKFYCQTIGKLFADIRNLGYTSENLLVAGRRRYFNEPRLLHEGKALEAVWHRALLDLLAALALIGEGRFVGDVISFKAGHRLDVKMVTLCYLKKNFRPFIPG